VFFGRRCFGCGLIGRLLLVAIGLGFLLGRPGPRTEEDVSRWRQRRQRFRHKLRQAVSELLADEGDDEA
jgi:hypothetical protein